MYVCFLFYITLQGVTQKHRAIYAMAFVIATIIVCNYRPTGVRRSFIYYNEDLVLCAFSCSIYLSIKSNAFLLLNNTFILYTYNIYNHSGHVNRTAIFIIPKGYIYTKKCLLTDIGFIDRMFKESLWWNTP